MPVFKISVNGTAILFAKVTDEFNGGVSYFHIPENMVKWAIACGADALTVDSLPEGLSSIGDIACGTLVDDEAIRAVITFYNNSSSNLTHIAKTDLTDVKGSFLLDSASTLFQCIFGESYSVCPYPTPERTREVLIVLGTIAGAVLILVIGCIIFHVGLPPCPCPAPRIPRLGFFERVLDGMGHVELAAADRPVAAFATGDGGGRPAGTPTSPAGVASGGEGADAAPPAGDSQHAHLLPGTPR